MKKFLTVLLVIAVMFTFSFGSAFAADAPATAMDKTKTVETEAEAYAVLDAAYEDAKDTLNEAVPSETQPADVSDAAWKAAVAAARQNVQVVLDKQYGKAYQGLRDAIKAFTDANPTTAILGYTYDTNVDAGYVGFAAAKAELDASAWICDNWDGTQLLGVEDLAGEAGYNKALADAIAAVEKYDIEQYAKDDKVKKTVNGQDVTKSSYDWAASIKADTLAELKSFGSYDAGTYDIAKVETIYKVENAGTLGVTKSGSFFDGNAYHPGMNALKTATVVTTDNAKIEYAKAKAIANLKAVVEKERNADLEEQNKVIFAQSIATKPNQAAIDKANEEIARINKEYDALLKVETYRLENADYKVVKDRQYENVMAYYNDAAYTNILKDTQPIGCFVNGTLLDVYMQDPTLAVDDLAITPADAVKVVDRIEVLKKDAEVLKSTIAVDGATKLDIDEALEDAIDATYMTGDLDIELSEVSSDTIVHVNAHKLLGTACPAFNVAAKAKVTVDGKEYPTVDAWEPADGQYSPNNSDAVYGIMDDADAAIKEAATVEDANKAFLDAYAKYDAVLTVADQKALYNYNGALYGKDAAAKKELEAYIGYRVDIMSDAPNTDKAVVKAKMAEYFGLDEADITKNFLEEVVDDASLQAAIADVKAAADSIKTAKELKAEGETLIKDINALKRPVTLAQKEEVLALKDRADDYADYCSMVAYNAVNLTRASTLIDGDVEDIADLERAALNAMKKALGPVEKLTLDAEKAVDEFVAAEDAFNALFGEDGDYADAINNMGSEAAKTYDEATAYADKIFDLKVTAVTNMIKALPVYPTTKQVVAAQDALKALGFKGICAMDDAWLTKLDKFAQDAEKAVIANVASLKIKASTKPAKKGSITVKWTVEGDTTGVEGYEIWRSTKKDSGYKKAFTQKATKKTYKNTKNLKKGTRYYYKVRAIAYTADDVKIKSDWSNKAHRIAK